MSSLFVPPCRSQSSAAQPVGLARPSTIAYTSPPCCLSVPVSVSSPAPDIRVPLDLRASIPYPRSLVLHSPRPVWRTLRRLATLSATSVPLCRPAPPPPPRHLSLCPTSTSIRRPYINRRLRTHASSRRPTRTPPPLTHTRTLTSRSHRRPHLPPSVRRPRRTISPSPHRRHHCCPRLVARLLRHCSSTISICYPSTRHLPRPPRPTATATGPPAALTTPTQPTAATTTVSVRRWVRCTRRMLRVSRARQHRHHHS